MLGGSVVSAFAQDGYRVASDDELADYEATLCALCNGERRQSATFEQTCAFVESALAGYVCRPCAIADWAEGLLEGRVPVDLMEPEDRTLTHQQLNLSTTACWILLGRMPVVVMTVVS